EQLRVTEGKLDHLADLADLAPEAADVLVVDLRDLRLFLFDRLLGNLDLRLRLDEDCVRPGRERRDDEIELAAHDAHADHVAAGRSEEHTSELQSLANLVCRLLL